MESENRKSPAVNLFTFIFLSAVLVGVVYFLTVVTFTSFNFFPRLQGYQAIAGICALAAGAWMVWIRKTEHENNKLYSFLTNWWIIFAYFPIYYVYACTVVIISSALFPHDNGAPTKASVEAFHAVEKILVENGYCKNKKTYDLTIQAVQCVGGPGAVGGRMIYGGFEDTIWGVSDPKVQEQIEQVHLDIYSKNPDIKHLIIYFDPNPVTQKQRESDDSYIEMEMRRK